MTTPATPRTRGRQNLRARRKAEMADAVHRIALRRFARDGYEQTSIADICHDVGISVRTFFRHFASKDELVGRVGLQLRRLILRHLRSQTDELPLTEAFSEAFVASVAELFRGDGQYMRDALTAGGDLFHVRGVFVLKSLEALHGLEIDDMDREFARRLGVSESDPEVRLLRGFLFICVSHAAAQWQSMDEADLGRLVRRNASFVATIEAARCRPSTRPGGPRALAPSGRAPDQERPCSVRLRPR